MVNMWRLIRFRLPGGDGVGKRQTIRQKKKAPCNPVARSEKLAIEACKLQSTGRVVPK
jgi:hypothetical protein